MEPANAEHNCALQGGSVPGCRHAARIFDTQFVTLYVTKCRSKPMQPIKYFAQVLENLAENEHYLFTMAELRDRLLPGL